MTAPGTVPTEAQLNELRYLVGYQLWPIWLELPFHEEALAQALARHHDLRLVAAYVLEQVCDVARERATSASQTKRIKVGPIEIEKSTASGTNWSVQAESACAKAKALRDEVASETRETDTANPEPLLTPVGYL